MKIVIASNNQHKIKEIAEIMTEFPITVCGYQSVLPPMEVEEDGTTFEENAMKKVQVFLDYNEYIYIGDDSGLEVKALNDAPGIYSARYAGEHASYTQLCEKLLHEMDGISDRRAQFRCVIAIRFPHNHYEVVEGLVTGQITKEMRGSQGFGYDPVFIPEGFTKTFAEMSADQKNKLSHRYRAMMKVKSKVEKFLDNDD